MKREEFFQELLLRGILLQSNLFEQRWITMKRYFLLAVLMLTACGIGGSLAEPTQNAINKIKKLTAQATALNGSVGKGEELFLSGKHSCLDCHGKHGAGGIVGPDLGRVGQRLTADQIMKKILQPGPGSDMPGNFADLISAQELSDLVAYLSQAGQ